MRTYSVLNGFASTSGPLFNGVHFGSSLNNLMATMYCTVISRSHAESMESSYVVVGGCEAVVDSRWQDNQIILLQLNSDPIVSLASNIKVSLSVPDVSDLLVLMDMLAEERLDLLLVDLAHSTWRDGNLVAVLVGALFSELINGVDGWVLAIENAQTCELLLADFTARVVWETLVGLFW